MKNFLDDFDFVASKLQTLSFSLAMVGNVSLSDSLDEYAEILKKAEAGIRKALQDESTKQAQEAWAGVGRILSTLVEASNKSEIINIQ